MMQKQRILHKRGILHGDGVTKMQMVWAEALQEHCVFDFWLSKESGEYADWFKQRGSKIYVDEPMNGSKERNLLRRINYYVCFLRQHKYECLHINTDALGAWNLLFASKIAGVKKRIIHSHNSNFAAGGSKLYSIPFVRILAREMMWLFSTERLACSREAALWLFPKRKVEQVKIIHNGIFVRDFIFDEKKREKYRNEYNLGDKFVIGFTGRLSRQKNIFFLLDVFCEYHKLDSCSVLMITGEGELESELKEYALALGIAEATIFAGYSNDIQGILSTLDCFVMPSLFEGLCVSLVEAQCNGLPCIVSNTISYDVRFTDLVAFVPIEQSNIKDWVSALSEAKQKNVDRNSYIESAMSSPFNIDNCSREILDVYNSL